MKHVGKLEYYLLALIAITLFNTFLGEQFASTTLVTILIALTVTYKGFMVIDHFMELKGANKNLRFLMKLYFTIFPSLIILSAFY
ncbi:cytochrome C oxidase subunit IV family protein [Candidatus Colwellia aromaticivorans]|uniref:cytochrome C oxidase subunit IV family protein n=1 Tax=Candidatus Colwellia aromaticivorans TaxID=2267621 RepID=UPI000DF24105|nr:cytochrome C oxidase subunit IV family protein [Candidatus Colwellia aromaticivorans]